MGHEDGPAECHNRQNSEEKLLHARLPKKAKRRLCSIFHLSISFVLVFP
jgi:hypothetical protein